MKGNVIASYFYTIDHIMLGCWVFAADQSRKIDEFVFWTNTQLPETMYLTVTAQ